MISLRGWHWAILVADGRVFMEGCAIPCDSAIAELYDPATGMFNDAGTPGAGIFSFTGLLTCDANESPELLKAHALFSARALGTLEMFGFEDQFVTEEERAATTSRQGQTLPP